MGRMTQPHTKFERNPPSRLRDRETLAATGVHVRDVQMHSAPHDMRLQKHLSNGFLATNQI